MGTAFRLSKVSLVSLQYSEYFLGVSLILYFHLGGPMFWADNYVGLPNILKKLEDLNKVYPGSEYFRPSDLLRKCVNMGVGVQEYYDTKGMKSKL
jgi:hypothetical protein